MSARKTKESIIKKNAEFAKKHNIPTLIETFDLNKEYWRLSGFRHLNDRFNPDWFRPAAIEQKKNGGVYTKAPFGSRDYRIFWETQIERIKNGYKTHGYRCPGDLYFFLNFYVLPKVKVKTGAGTVAREMGHPDFWDVHYYFSHYVEWGRKLGKDGVCVKPRGVGWSEFVANMGVARYTAFRDSVSVYAASDEKYLTTDGILTKAWRQLEYMNENTQRGFKKLRQVRNVPLHKRASKKDREGNESGWMSEIIGIIADSPKKIRGTRTDLLVMEEGGSFKNSKKAVMTAKALTEIGGVKIGYLIIFGTGGDESSSGKALEGLIDMFYRPEIFDMLPIRNKYNDSREIRTTGFFFGIYEAQQRFMNHQGITDISKSYVYEQEKRKKYEEAGAVKELQDYKAEYPFFPEEAFSKNGTSIFDKIKLSNTKIRIKSGNITLKPERGELEWVYKPKTNIITGVKWTKLPDGRIQILEHPRKDGFGKVYKNLYIGGIDSIDFGVDNSLIGEAGSKFAIVIKKKFLHAEELNNFYVAIYKERPKDERIAYEIALKLLIYFNAKANLERTRKELISYFRQKKMLKYLSKQPSILSNDVNAKKFNNNIGTPINPKIIQHYLINIKEYIDDYSDFILFLDMLDELLEYSYELKTKFDYVAAMGMCELLDEDVDAAGLNPQSSGISETEGLSSWGYYYDEKGIKRFGKLPENDSEDLYNELEIDKNEFEAGFGNKEEEFNPLHVVDPVEEPVFGQNEDKQIFELNN